MRIGGGEGFTMRNFIICTDHLNIARVIKYRRYLGLIARMEEDRSAFKILTDKPTGRKPLGRPRHRWENNIKTYLKEIGINTRNLAEDRDYWVVLVNAALNLRVP
jgi:hypothetical protein